MDWYLASMPDLAQTFRVTLPSGFGYDFAGIVDEVGGDAEGFAVGDRVYGGILGGGAAGGVGVFAVQLARLAGARVIGTGSESSHAFLRALGAEPVAYGPVSPIASRRSPPTA